MSDVAAGRASTYALLSVLYSAAPSKALAESLPREIAGGSPGAAASELTAFLEEAASMNRAGIENEWVAEHTRLFVLPSGVGPYESLYLDEQKRLGGRISVGVRRFYEDAGAQFTQACLDLPDHIGIELEFMKFLCVIEEQFWKESNVPGLQRCVKFQNDFLADHLLRWCKPLCERVLNEARLGMYRALARFTMEFLETEREFVPELTREIHTEWRNVCVSES
jgi:TorA maturation chaperone TorD